MNTDPVLPVEDPLYPSSDGLPLAENDWQLKAIHDAFGVLDLRYLDRPDVYVSADLLIYYEEGNPRKSVAPDVFGAAKHNRMVYKLWEEPKAPDFVLEVASKNTWEQDLGRKRSLYAELGVREHWLSTQGTSTSIPRCRDCACGAASITRYRRWWRMAHGTIRSRALGLDLCVENQVLRFREPATGDYLHSLAEATKALTEANAARLAAEARIAELEARLKER